VVNSKRKGKEGEREFAHLCQTFGFQARRGQQYRGGPDSPDVVGLPFLHVEVKRRERVDLYEGDPGGSTSEEQSVLAGDP
jgi:Holliday junction resolvase